MPEKELPKPKLTFQQHIAGKSLEELALSIKSREPLLKKKENTQIKIDLELLHARQKDLQRLLDKTDVDEIDKSLNVRKSVMLQLTKDSSKDWEKKAREVEIAVLRQARERQMYILRVNAKSPAEITQSIKDREKLLTTGKQTAEDKGRISRALDVLRNRQEELSRHQNKTNPADVIAGVKMRQRMLEDVGGKDEVSQLRSQKLLVEIKILQDVIQEIQPKSLVKAVRPEKAVVKSASIKKETVVAPEKRKTGERIGKHGVIITPLVEDGVRINGNKLRQGVDVTRSVSLKSSEQYTDSFKDLYSAELSGNELNVNVPGAKEKLIAKKRERMQILKLITIAYMPDNFEMKNFLQRDCGFKSDTYDKAVKPALAYLRYLVENRIGNALESDDRVVKGLGNPVILEQSLRKILEVIKKDVNSVKTNFQNELSSHIPHVRTSQIEDRDTLHLGLLIRQFRENNDARKEHKIDDLIERFR